MTDEAASMSVSLSLVQASPPHLSVHRSFMRVTRWGRITAMEVMSGTVPYAIPTRTVGFVEQHVADWSDPISIRAGRVVLGCWLGLVAGRGGLAGPPGVHHRADALLGVGAGVDVEP